MAQEECLTAQARAGKATYLLMMYGPLTAKDLSDRLGYRHHHSIQLLLDNLSLGAVPVYEPQPGLWDILRDEPLQELF